jgi:hypothetical protein
MKKLVEAVEELKLVSTFHFLFFATENVYHFLSSILCYCDESDYIKYLMDDIFLSFSLELDAVFLH